MGVGLGLRLRLGSVRVSYGQLGSVRVRVDSFRDSFSVLLCARTALGQLHVKTFRYRNNILIVTDRIKAPHFA